MHALSTVLCPQVNTEETLGTESSWIFLIFVYCPLNSSWLHSPASTCLILQWSWDPCVNRFLSLYRWHNASLWVFHRVRKASLWAKRMTIRRAAHIHMRRAGTWEILVMLWLDKTYVIQNKESEGNLSQPVADIKHYKNSWGARVKVPCVRGQRFSEHRLLSDDAVWGGLLLQEMSQKFLDSAGCCQCSSLSLELELILFLKTPHALVAECGENKLKLSWKCPSCWPALEDLEVQAPNPVCY